MPALKLTSHDYYTNAQKAVAEELKLNLFATPRITKIVINVGIGKFKDEKSQQEEVIDLLQKLTGQTPRKIHSKEAISGFKLKAGDLVGLQVTLRGKKVHDFLLNLVYLSLPRTKDFKGIKRNAWDSKFASYSIGIPDASIFPQIGFNAKINFGLQATICFAQGTENNVQLLEKLNFPFFKIKQ